MLIEAGNKVIENALNARKIIRDEIVKGRLMVAS